MRHKYKGYGYQIIIYDNDTLRYKIFERGIRNRFRWNQPYTVGERIQSEKDECEESFAVRLHQMAHLRIDDMAYESDSLATLEKVCKDTRIGFLSRVAK